MCVQPLFHFLLVEEPALPLGTIPNSLWFLTELSIKVPHPLLAMWAQNKIQAWPIRMPRLLASDGFRDGHVTKDGSVNDPWEFGEFYSVKHGGGSLFWTCCARRVGPGAAGELHGLFCFPQPFLHWDVPQLPRAQLSLALAQPLLSKPTISHHLGVKSRLRTQGDESVQL